MTDTPAPLPVPVLDAAQMRVLGCLVEKEATTPETYPLTVNAAQTAANQKTARDPVMNLDAGTVQHALRQLEAMGLARQHFSARAERYEHLLGAKLDLPRQQVALLGLLLLRGPPTAPQLPTRGDRTPNSAAAEDLRHQLGRLIQRGLAVQLPRAAGQREDRSMHLLGGPVDVDALAAQFRAPAGAAADNGALEERVAQLEAAVAALQEQLARLQSRLDD